MAKQSFSIGQVLTAAQMTSLQQTAMLGGSATAKTTSYTLVAADAGTVVSVNSTSATTITVDAGLFAAGDTVTIQNWGSGAVTITAGTATVNTAGSLIVPQYDGGVLYFTSASAAIYFDFVQAGAVSPLTTKGDLYTFGSSDTRIGVGSNGQLLAANSATATGLEWQTVSSGGLTLISEQAVSAVSSVTFGSIPQTYKQLYLVWSGIRHSNNTSSFSIRLNNDSSSIYRSNFFACSNSTWSDQDGNFNHIGSTSHPSFGVNANSAQVRHDNAGFLILDNYASTTRPKFVYGEYWFFEDGGNYRYVPYRGIYDTTTEITSIDIVRLLGAGTITNNNNSSIRLYGLS